MRVIDDEPCLVFECPACFDKRAIRQQLFSQTAGVGQDVHRFLRQQDQQGVFWFMLACLREVKELAGRWTRMWTGMIPIELLYAQLVFSCESWGLALASPPRNSRLHIHQYWSALSQRW